jgi:hypothetical protein
VASYRDPRYPEVLRFPGDLRPRILICIAIFVNLCCAFLSLVISSPSHIRLIDALVLCGLTYLYYRAWPGDITSDPQGLRAYRMFGRLLTFIPWTDIRSVDYGTEFGGRPSAALGLTTDILTVRSSSSPRPIIHTSRHPDRPRLLRELEAHKIPVSPPPPAP